MITPVVSGPYDLGNVVVRAALQGRPNNRPNYRRLRSASPDPRGHPAAAAFGLLELNRPNFTLNPTNCSPLRSTPKSSALKAPRQASQGLSRSPTAAPSPSLQNSPSDLWFHQSQWQPGAQADCDLPPGGTNANISRVSVTLPHSEFLDNAHIKSPCTRVQFSAGMSAGLLSVSPGPKPPTRKAARRAGLFAR